MFFLAKFVRDKTAKKLKKNAEEEKPFLEHLEDLRGTLFKILITLGVVTISTFVFNKPLLKMVQLPLYMADIPEEARQLQTLGAVEGMMLAIKVSFFSGIILSFPLLLFFIGEFVMPGLKDNEKKLILPSLTVGALLFATGLSFAYFVVIPMALEFFYNFSIERGWGYDLRAGYYYSFAVQMTLVFGLSFELPVVVMALVKLEILSHRVMRNTRSTAIVIMVIASAVITPTTDVFTLSLLAGPLIILYEICIWMAWWLEKKRERADRREREKALREATPLAEPPALGDSESGSDHDGDSDSDGDGEDGGEGGTPKPSPAPHLSDVAHVDSDHLESVEFNSDNEFDEDEHQVEVDDELEPDITPEGETADADGHDGHDDPHSSDHGDDYWNDPYHHDHHYDEHHDYYSGPIEELKRELREELTMQIKAELRDEILVELRKELIANPTKRKRISLDPRRFRRPR